MIIAPLLKKIILNGDDFGYTKGINVGIRTCIEKGILTSTSVMVNRPFANEAKKLLQYKNISVGIHLDLTEENYVKRWSKVLNILIWPKSKVRKEFNKQIERFVAITGKLPDHIDSHHHIHWMTSFRSVVLEFSKKHKIPVRCNDATFQTGFYGRSLTKWNDPNNVSSHKLMLLMDRLPTGTHEIMCHPGQVDGELIASQTTYLYQRESEVSALTSREIKSFLKRRPNIKLISWQDVMNSKL